MLKSTTRKHLARRRNSDFSLSVKGKLIVTFFLLSGVSEFTRTELQRSVQLAREGPQKMLPHLYPDCSKPLRAFGREKTEKFLTKTKVKHCINFGGKTPWY